MATSTGEWGRERDEGNAGEGERGQRDSRGGTGGRRTKRPRSRLEARGCARSYVIGRGGPWQGGLPGSTKRGWLKLCSLGVPCSLQAELERHAYPE